MAKKAPQTAIRVSKDTLAKIKELATAQNRSAANYLETLVNREYSALKLGLEFTGVEPVEED